MAETDLAQIRQVVGLDFDMTFRITAYGSQGCTTFFPGRAIKTRRTHFKILQQNLQHRQTPSARRRLKHSARRENRWMTDVNHQVSQARVARYGAQTLFVVEDLTGIRGTGSGSGGATGTRPCRGRFPNCGRWQMLEYKAALHYARTVAVDQQ